MPIKPAIQIRMEEKFINTCSRKNVFAETLTSCVLYSSFICVTTAKLCFICHRMFGSIISKPTMAPITRYLERSSFRCLLIKRARKMQPPRNSTEYLFKKANPKVTPIHIQYLGFCDVISFNTKNRSNVQKNNSKITGINNDEV